MSDYTTVAVPKELYERFKAAAAQSIPPTKGAPLIQELLRCAADLGPVEALQQLRTGQPPPPPQPPPQSPRDESLGGADDLDGYHDLSGVGGYTIEEGAPPNPEETRRANPEGAIPTATGPVPEYPPEAELASEYAGLEWPRVEIPENVFEDLQLTPDMYPDTGFIPWYLQWVEPTTDAPRPFHFATALSILGTTLGPNWAIEHRSLLGGNLWLMLIAGSGARKSTAMQIHVKLVPEQFRHEGPFESSLSFVERMAERPNLLWYMDEASAFFDCVASRRKFLSDLPPRLTTAYCGDPLVYSSAQHKHNVRRPYLSILTGTPLSWIRDKGISEDFIKGGIFGRFLLVPATRVAVKKLDPPRLNPTTREHLARWLDAVYKAGEAAPRDILGNVEPWVVKLAPDAKQVFLSWVKSRGDANDLFLTGAWSRAEDTAKKLALLYHVSTGHGANVAVSRDTIERAIRAVDGFFLPAHLWATKRIVAMSPFKATLYQIEERLEASVEGEAVAGMSHELGAPAADIYRALYALHQADRLDFWYWRFESSEKGSVLAVRHGAEPLGRPGDLRLMQQLPNGVRRYAELIGDVPKGLDLDELANLAERQPAQPPQPNDAEVDDDPCVEDPRMADTEPCEGHYEDDGNPPHLAESDDPNPPCNMEPEDVAPEGGVVGRSTRGGSCIDNGRNKPVDGNLHRSGPN